MPDKSPKTYLFDGATLHVALSGDAAGGSVAILDAVVPPGAGSAPHSHAREEETGLVLEGALQIETRGETFSVSAGQAMSLPRNVPHRLSNVTGETTHVLLICTPAGLDRFVEEIGHPVTENKPISSTITPEVMRHVDEVSRRFGISIVNEAAL